MSTDKGFPSMRWHPETGEAQVFNAAHEVPEGWLDTHPNNPARAPAADDKGSAGEQLDLTRDEIKAALDEGGIAWAKNAKTAALYAQLAAAVKENLTARNITFAAEATVRELLALAKQPAA